MQPTINALARVHALVSGRVQGVGFRAFAVFHATTLGLTGWVQNLNDGRVELVAEGPVGKLDQLMQKVAKGPAGARVEHVERKDEPHTGEFKGFRTKR